MNQAQQNLIHSALEDLAISGIHVLGFAAYTTEPSHGHVQAEAASSDYGTLYKGDGCEAKHKASRAIDLGGAQDSFYGNAQGMQAQAEQLSALAYTFGPVPTPRLTPSPAMAVEAFNTLTGHMLTTADAKLLQTMLEHTQQYGVIGVDRAGC